MAEGQRIGTRRLARTALLCAFLRDVLRSPPAQDIDAHLSAELRAEVAAFREMIMACLWPALVRVWRGCVVLACADPCVRAHTRAQQYFWFVESTNYYRVVRPEIVKYVSFPRSVYYPTLFARNVASSLASQHLSRAKIEARVEACLTAVSDRMGARPYLLGDRPTSADATLFAFLSAMLQPVLPEAFLAHAVEKHTKLMKLFESMRDVHFDGFRTVAPSPTLPAPLLKHSKHSKPRADDEPLTDEQRSVRRFFMVAGAAVFTYAMLFDVLGIRSALRAEANGGDDDDEDGEGANEDDERDGTFDPEDV